jgi:hypothetical protein
LVSREATKLFAHGADNNLSEGQGAALNMKDCPQRIQHLGLCSWLVVVGGAYF